MVENGTPPSEVHPLPNVAGQWLGLPSPRPQPAPSRAHCLTHYAPSPTALLSLPAAIAGCVGPAAGLGLPYPPHWVPGHFWRLAALLRCPPPWPPPGVCAGGIGWVVSFAVRPESKPKLHPPPPFRNILGINLSYLPSFLVSSVSQGSSLICFPGVNKLLTYGDFDSGSLIYIFDLYIFFSIVVY